jgi:hypothetical protein
MFQRMMEWVLRDLENADPYVDDIIIGSSGENMEEIMANHEKDVRAVLRVLREENLIVDPKKANMFMGEVEFCGHILREGRRSPAPGKLLSIQKWELPGTVTALRGFLGLTNYYSSYVHNYAALAAPLMGKLQVNRLDGKKGSLKPVAWDDESKAAFEALKEALKEGLQVFQLEPDQPFVLRTDASDFAIGAVLEQERKGEWVPVSFFSRKLGQSQLNWTPEKRRHTPLWPLYVSGLDGWVSNPFWSKRTIARSNTGLRKTSILRRDQEGVVPAGTKPSHNLIWRSNICPGRIIPWQMQCPDMHIQPHRRERT